jgi:hypothetical protein
MARSILCLLTAIVLLGAFPAGAADVGGLTPAGPVVVEEPLLAPVPPTAIEDEPPFLGIGKAPVPRTALLPPPRVRFGCQRVWRCDTTVCEWRRGCWGVYGYVEGPYYSPIFARRQWESHGLGYPQERRRRSFK